MTTLSDLKAMTGQPTPSTGELVRELTRVAAETLIDDGDCPTTFELMHPEKLSDGDARLLENHLKSCRACERLVLTMTPREDEAVQVVALAHALTDGFPAGASTLPSPESPEKSSRHQPETAIGPQGNAILQSPSTAVSRPGGFWSVALDYGGLAGVLAAAVLLFVSLGQMRSRNALKDDLVSIHATQPQAGQVPFALALDRTTWMEQNVRILEERMRQSTHKPEDYFYLGLLQAEMNRPEEARWAMGMAETLCRADPESQSELFRCLIEQSRLKPGQENSGDLMATPLSVDDN